MVPANFEDEVHDLRSQFVSLPGASLERDQTTQTTRLKNVLSLIERRARKSKGFGRFADRVPVFLNPAQHLIFDLDQIARIEEPGVRE